MIKKGGGESSGCAAALSPSLPTIKAPVILSEAIA